MKKIIITGGTGFIGRPLVSALRHRGYLPIVFARHSREGVIGVDLSRELIPQELMEGTTAIIHLAGASLFQRWTPKIKQEIYESRILSTRNIVTSLERVTKRPTAFITASAVGYYGDRGEKEINETMQAGSDFLAHVCADWEKEAQRAEALDVRVVHIRTAPVLGSGGGILEQLTPWYTRGLGSIWGSGQQWFPWISLTDIVEAYCFALEHAHLSGPINAAAPQAIRQEHFALELAQQLHRRRLIRAPGWVLKLLLGELGETLLTSQHIVPQKLLNYHFRFQHPAVAEALEAALLNRSFHSKAATHDTHSLS